MPTSAAYRLGPRIPIVALGISLSAFLALSFLLCILLGSVVQGWGMHQPWLQFFPGFVWLTPGSILLGLAESVAYAWYVAFVFGGLFNLVAARTAKERRGRRAEGNPPPPGG